MKVKNMSAIYEIAAGEARIDPHAVTRQIGHGNMLAISGGRATFGYSCVILPVAYGHHVVVTLNADDTYRVRRVFLRGGKAFVKAEFDGVYADRIGEIAYEASCYADA